MPPPSHPGVRSSGGGPDVVPVSVLGRPHLAFRSGAGLGTIHFDRRGGTRAGGSRRGLDPDRVLGGAARGAARCCVVPVAVLDRPDLAGGGGARLRRARDAVSRCSGARCSGRFVVPADECRDGAGSGEQPHGGEQDREADGELPAGAATAALLRFSPASARAGLVSTDSHRTSISLHAGVTTVAAAARFRRPSIGAGFLLTGLTLH